MTPEWRPRGSVTMESTVPPTGLHCSMGVGFHTLPSPGAAHSSLNHDRSSALGGAERLRQRQRPGTGDALSSALTASAPDEEHTSLWRAHPHGSTNFPRVPPR